MIGQSQLLLISLFLVGLTSCSKGLIYEKYLEIDQKSWEYENPVTFEVEVEKPEDSYDLYVNLRHSNDYPYSNLWLMLYTLPPEGQPTQQRLELKLARPDGSWIGNSLGGTITHEIRVRSNMELPAAGTYTYTIQHDMRMNQVPAVSHVGIRLSKADDQ